MVRFTIKRCALCRWLSLVAALMLLVQLIPVGVAAAAGPGATLADKFNESVGTAIDSDAEEPTYAEVKIGYTTYLPYTGEKLPLELRGAALGGNAFGVVPGTDGEEALLWTVEDSAVTVTFTAPVTGLYDLSVVYYALDGNGDGAQRKVSIDGKVPFDEAYTVTFDRFWRDEGEPLKNSIGDEVRPNQEELRHWAEVRLTDNLGLYSEPFTFYLTAGEHTLTLEWVEEPMAIRELALVAPVEVPTYYDYLLDAKAQGFADATESVDFEAETHVLEKNTQVIRREYNGDPKTTPSGGDFRILNTVGGTMWAEGGQWVTWEFEVKTAGLYRLDIRAGQWFTDGLPAYRSIYLDGEIPFAELREYKFAYNSDWRLETLRDPASGNPFLFALEAGRHTLTMKAVLGEMTPVLQKIQKDSAILSAYYRKIIMITGVEPDLNKEYDLHKTVPGLLKALETVRDDMDGLAETMVDIAGKRTSVVNKFLSISEQLTQMLKRPDNISRKLEELQSAMSDLGDYTVTLQETPLSVDYFCVSAPSREYVNARSNFFQKLIASLRNLLLSFFKDYDSVAGIGVTNDAYPSLEVWVGRGSEWAEIIKHLADEDFTPRHQLNIHMNIVPASQLNSGSANTIMLAIAAGNGPDVAMGVSSGSPVEFAIRNAIVDVSKFAGYGEVAKRFFPAIHTPFAYDGGIYAIPEQMEFTVMFYRKDILEEMNVRIPNTWDEVYRYTLPALSRNGMEFAPSGFSTFLYQLGGQYYTDDNLQSALDTPEAYQAFLEWTEQYTNYGMPVSFNFFNRFRTGEMPIGFGGYALYVQLVTAAPELNGRWGVALVPGHAKADGSIDRSVAEITGQCSMILSSSTMQEEAFAFLDWWMTEDVQVRYGRELEALLGSGARWNTANIAAFARLPWDREDRQIILEQLGWGKGVPVVLGGYFTSRHINNAWNRVVVSGTTDDGKTTAGKVTPRDSLDEAVKDINKEMRAKQNEYATTNRKKGGADE